MGHLRVNMHLVIRPLRSEFSGRGASLRREWKSIKSIIENLLSGGSCLLQGFSIIRRAGLRRYVLAPLLVNVLIFGLTNDSGG